MEKKKEHKHNGFTRTRNATCGLQRHQVALIWFACISRHRDFRLSKYFGCCCGGGFAHAPMHYLHVLQHLEPTPTRVASRYHLLGFWELVAAEPDIFLRNCVESWTVWKRVFFRPGFGLKRRLGDGAFVCVLLLPGRLVPSASRCPVWYPIVGCTIGGNGDSGMESVRGGTVVWGGIEDLVPCSQVT
jgi:hypothetical protein